MDSRVRQTVALIGEQLQARMTVDDLAAQAGLSVSQLTRLFRRDVGTTPSDFANQLRMERAAVLLERTNLSVSEVMAQVGIADPSHFARDFRRAHGFSPRTFRQHLRHAARPHWQPGNVNERTAQATSTAPIDRRSGRQDRRRFTRTDRRRAGS